MTTEHRKGIQGAAWLNIVLGALILLTPFFTSVGVLPFWSAVLSGAVVIVLAGYNAYEANQRHTEKALGPAVANVVIGLWVLVSPFVFAAVSTAYTTALVIFGIALIAAAGYNTWAASDARKHEPRRMHA